jgi:hypothetical protein
MTGVGRKRMHLFDYLKSRRRYLEPKEEAEDRQNGNDRFVLSYEQKEENQVLFHKSQNLLTSSTS